MIRFRKDDGSAYPDWEKKTVGDIFEFTNGKGHEQNVVEDGGYIIVNSKFISTEGKVKKYSDRQILPLYKNDIAMVMSDLPNGKALAKCYLIDENDKYTLNQRICCLRSDENAVFMANQLSRNSYYLRFDDGYQQTNLKKEEVLSCPVFLPCLEEQQKIANFLSSVDEVIAESEKEVANLEAQKKGAMQKIFSQEVRFKADDGSDYPKWEEKRLGETLTVQRGGSPRPIENYITDKEDGLNWIKIGDVSPDTNTIKATKEKIISEGLKKTRQVFVGDLILSNSMSFGRPYILEIDGCIHDGWLLIKDYQKCFYREYLCYLLASDSVKNQYVRLSAGSTVQNLNSDLVQSVTVGVPCLEEQKKIADFLSDFDTAIEEAKKELESWKQIKKGLLQQMFV